MRKRRSLRSATETETETETGGAHAEKWAMRLKVNLARDLEMRSQLRQVGCSTYTAEMAVTSPQVLYDVLCLICGL